MNEGATGRPVQIAWHTVDAQDVLARLASGANGLAGAEAARRLREQGPNRLPRALPRSALARLLAQFNNLLIFVLLAAAVIALLLGHWVDMAVILAVVLVNAVVGFIQEGKAERALDAIRDMLTPRASVIRDGRRVTVPAEEIVAGDLVLLEAGDRVPADLRLVRARNLQLQEAVLTGESLAVEKSSAAVPADAPLGDRRSMAFSGTLVTAGQGTGVVIGTGAATELGRISALLGAIEPMRTPLLRQIDRFARQLTIFILGVSVLVFLFAVFVRSYVAGEAFMAVVALAVAAIPEGLPAVMTVTLALGVQRMAARHAIIRRLPAVETLGAVSIICSDKTGTLTRNEMTAVTVLLPHATVEVSGAGYDPRGGFEIDGRALDPANAQPLSELARAALLCNDAGLREAPTGWVVDGDPMEGALLALARKAGMDIAARKSEFPRLDDIPFDAQSRFMATLHRDPAGGVFLCVKGAPEKVLAMCRHQRGPDGDEPFDPAAWHTRSEALAARAQRLLAVATAVLPAAPADLTPADVEGRLTLLGLVGLIDPPRAEAIEAVRECQAAGISVKMITGDHALTARAVAAQLGLAHPDRVITGQDLDRLSDEALRAAALDANVFARTHPEHKLRLVEALQHEGAVVAMTGDGVNDAPALKRADIGVAMGQKGTDAAKEAAGMVLADDNFASIVVAVREGRTVYDNLTKVIAWTLPTNGGEALAVIAAVLAGLTLPLTPLQILWVNMVTDLTLGLTLAFEPTERDTMRRPPRAGGTPLLPGFLVWRIGFVSVLFVLGLFGIFFWVQSRGADLEEARTVAVNTLVVLEIFYLFSIRYLHAPSLTLQGVLGTRAVLIGVGVTVALQLAFTYAPPFQMLFDTRAVSLVDGAAVIAIGIALLVILELEKLVWRRLGRWELRPSSSRPSGVHR